MSKVHSARAGREETQKGPEITKGQVSEKLTAWSPVVYRYFHQFRETKKRKKEGNKGRKRQSYTLPSFSINIKPSEFVLPETMRC